MKFETQTKLISYLLALKSEGFDRLHVSDVIPQRTDIMSGFPKINETLLRINGIEYDSLGGWFTI